MKFQGKTVWITGSSSGIGKALAEEMASLQCRLILSSRNLESLHEVKQNCEARGSSVTLVRLDLASTLSIDDACAEVFEKHSRLDILINNAGVSQRGLAVDTSLEVDRRIMETNFFGTVYLTKKVLPAMQAQGEGYIAVISSIAGKFGFPLRTTYSAAKHALQGFFESLRAEVKPQGIKVSIISPGRVKTAISFNALESDGTPHGRMDDGQQDGISAEICAKRIIRGLEKEKKDFLVGGKELLMVYIRRFLPALYHRMVTRISAT